MCLRITRGRFDPARYDESVALSQEVGDAIARLPGFVDYRGGGDRGSGAIVAVSAWETAEQARFPREALGDVPRRSAARGRRRVDAAGAGWTADYTATVVDALGGVLETATEPAFGVRIPVEAPEAGGAPLAGFAALGTPTP